jgi:hypothetical protein
VSEQKHDSGATYTSVQTLVVGSGGCSKRDSEVKWCVRKESPGLSITVDNEADNVEREKIKILPSPEGRITQRMQFGKCLTCSKSLSRREERALRT